jgi:hypothetical protein
MTYLLEAVWALAEQRPREEARPLQRRQVDDLVAQRDACGAARGAARGAAVDAIWQVVDREVAGGVHLQKSFHDRSVAHADTANGAEGETPQDQATVSGSIQLKVYSSAVHCSKELL